MRFAFIFFALLGVLSLRPSSMAQPQTYTLPGLDGEITIVFDEYDIPHIYATTTRDLFAAQGFVHASARAWQMDWLRRTGAGRLSEFVGVAALEEDIAMRTLGLPRYANANLERLPDDAATLLESYASGVNGWLAQAPPPAEYALLAEYGFTAEVEAWQPLDSMLIQSLQALSFNSTGMFTEIFKSIITEELGIVGTSLLLPPYPYDAHPVIMQPGWTPETDTSAAIPAFPRLDMTLRALAIYGSNSWTMSGALTETGMPLLANDTHMSVRFPSFWYQNGLHCVELSDACPYDVYGFSIPGTPGVIIGHNQAIGWGMTNAQVDMTDFYVLTLNDANQYLYNGEYRDMETISETFYPADGEPVTVDVHYTVFGSVLTSFEGMSLATPLALRWTNADSNRTFEAVLELNRATDWETFQAALGFFDAPGLNFHYADRDGNIGYVLAGLIPRRVAGHDGALPVPGIDDSYQWNGYVDAMDNPRLFNPESGYIVSANNAIIHPDDFPYPIANFYDYGYRAARAETLLQATDSHSIATFREIQLDSFNPAAPFLVPALTSMGEFERPELTEAAAWLGEWDYQNRIDSPHALLFNVFWTKLLLLALDELPLYESSHSIYMLEAMMAAPLHPLWINQETGLFGRDAILREAFAQAYDEVVSRFGGDMTMWRYGDLHFVRFTPDVLRYLPVEAAEREALSLLVPVDGGFSSLNVASFNPLRGLEPDNIPTMRMILDFSDFDNSLMIAATAQIADETMITQPRLSLMWAAGEYQEYSFSREAVLGDSAYEWLLSE